MVREDARGDALDVAAEDRVDDGRVGGQDGEEGFAAGPGAGFEGAGDGVLMRGHC